MTCMPGSLRVAVLSAALVNLLACPAIAASRLASATGGQVRAVVVGIDDYQNFRSLHGAKADATDLADALTQGGAQVTTLLDSQARRAAVVAALDALVASSRKGDLAIVAFAGHGTRVPEYDFPGWKGVEPGGMNEEFVLGAYSHSRVGTSEVVINKEMKAWIARLDAKGVEVLFVADTCFGGGLVRHYDPRTAPPAERGVPSVDRPEPGRFKPIPMTMAELLTNVSDLEHVTFLSGADPAHEVPEVQIPGEAGPRGALSYSMARLLRGEAGTKGDGTVTRRSVFEYVLQSVNQYTDGQQDVDREPKALDPKVLDRAVLRVGDAPAPAPAQTVTPAPVHEVQKNIGVAFIDGDAPLVRSLAAVSPPFRVVDQASADVVWDLGTKEVVVRGDVMRRGADIGEFPGILYRVLATDAVKQISEPRLTTVSLDAGGVTYTPGGTPPTFRASDVVGRDLVALDLTSTGVLQVIYPYDGQEPAVDGAQWSYTPNVVAPFGADQVVVVTAPKGSLRTFSTWAWGQDQRPAAAILPERLRNLVTTVPDVRIGTVDLVTAP